MNSNLLLAILSMDAYNRGGGSASRGLVVDADVVGGATVDISKTDNLTGFFAQAYDLNGQKIISYRGTDDAHDRVSGWPVGGGAYTAPQALEAAQFYQLVVGGGSTSNLTLNQLYSANVWLTGHSLGGGLAGLIASVYGQHATVFDSMAFSLAASSLYVDTTTPLLNGHVGEAQYYLGSQPNPISASGIRSLQVEGQSLDTVGAPADFTYSLGNDVPLAGRQLHSIALLVVAMYADDAGVGDDWLNAANYVLPELYDDNIALKLGIASGGATGTDTASGKMLTMIAYSALDEGNFFGKTAIRAFLHDAGDFGELLVAENLPGYLNDSGVRKAIGEIIAEYAGLLANNHDTNQSNALGVLTYSPGSNRLAIDFSHNRWTVSQGPNQADVIGKKDLTEAAIKFSGSEPSSVQQALDTLWSGKTDKIIKLVAATTDPSVTLDAVADGGIGAQGTLPTDGAMLVAGGGGDLLTGSQGNDLLVGGAGDDTLAGGTGTDLMFGGGGKDTFILGQGGSNWVDGGPGYDTVKYETTDPLTVIVANTNGVIDNTDPNNTNPPTPIIKVTDNSGQTPATDYLAAVEDIKLGTGPNTLNVSSLTKVPYNSTIDLNATRLDSNDTVNLSQYSGNVYLSSAHPVQGGPNAVELYRTRAFGNDTGLGFTNFNTLILGNGDNKVQLYSADDPYLTTVQTGNGDNTITSDIVNLTVNLGKGHNIVGHLAMGTTVNTSGNGGNKFITSDDILLTGLTPTDEIFGNGILLRGAVGEIGSEDPWIVGPDGTRYGLNQQGDLVIEDTSGGKTYVAGYHGGPDVPYPQQTAGIFVGLAEVHAERLLDLKRPYIENVSVMFKLGNELLYVRTGQTFFNNDPLVFDLGGTGVNLTALSGSAPMLDMRGNGFATHTGWVGANDGILVLQPAGQGGTPTISEMFGGPGAEGFAALAQYDVNADGVIDASDAIYSQLRMWVDVNHNGKVDTGELETLQQAGVASISLAATARTGDTQAGNTITATGSFTRVDGTTGAIDDVNFNVDTFHSKYLGSTTVSTAAAAMPNLKGYGTLTDLRVAMTLDPTLIDTINADLPNLDVPNLAALRAAALPILEAWAKAVKLPDAGGNLQVVDPTAGHSDVPILLSSDANGNVTVDDFGYLVTDASGSYWKLAGGGLVKDADGNTIARPTFAQVMAQAVASGSSDSWQNFSAGEIGFLERFYGQPFPIDQAPGNPTAMLAAMSNFITGAITALNLDALRLAMQGPLGSFFPGIVFDASTDTFTATTAADLTPMYQAIFQAAPSDAAGAAAWLAQWTPIIDIVLGDFNRGAGQPQSQVTGQKVTYGYQFASMVRAYEASNLPLDIGAVATALGVPVGEVMAGGSTLSGPNQATIYYLFGGDQTVVGGVGLNNFVMGGIFGHDTIIDDEPAPSRGDPSILRFTSVKSTDVTATRNGLDLILAVNGTSEQVTVAGEFTGVRLGFNGVNFNDNVGVAQIEFSDGVLWDMPDIARAVSRPDSTHAVITGTFGMDVLDGGAGGDTHLSGGDGSDIYIFGRYGHDTIEVDRTDPFNGASDVVKFGPGISKSDLVLSRIGQSNDLQIAIKGTSDRLTIVSQFDAGYSLFGALWLDRIEGFKFADSSSYSWDEIIQMLDAQAKGPAIYGFDYADTLNGGPGVHYMSGGNENDTYVFGPGDSFDTVKDATINILSGMNDTIQLAPGVMPADVKFSLQGTAGDMLMTLADGSTMLIKGEFAIDIGSISFNRIENFQFDDGTAAGITLGWDQIRRQIITASEAAGSPVVIGTDYADVLDPGAGTGNHYLSGGNGADTYVFGHGYGHDTIDVNATELLNSGNALVGFKADVAQSDVQWSRLGQDLVIKLNGGNDSLTVLGEFAGLYSGAGVASFVFADGTTLTAADVGALATAVNVTGSSGNDTIQSTAADEVLAGGNGNDTYVYARGDGFDRIETGKTLGAGYVDTLSFTDIASTEVTLMRWGGRGIDDLVIAIDGRNGAPQGQVTIAGQFAYGENPADAAINAITFSDGVTWSEADIEAKLLAQEEAQTGANITVYGFSGADTLTARDGATTLVGGNGGDTYVWSAGNGATWIADQGKADTTTHVETDTLLIHGLTSSQLKVSRNPDPSAHDLILTPSAASGGGSPIVLVNQTAGQSTSVIERVVLDDGTVWDYSDLLLQADGGIATAPNGTTARSFAGAAANSTLAGTASDDVYFWGAGDGNDTIAEGSQDPWQKTDVLRLAGLNAADVTFNIVENSTRDLLITDKATGETLTVLGQFGSASNDGSSTWAGAGTGLERIVFADGTVWNPQQILSHSVYVAAPGGTSVSNLGLGDGTLAVQASPGVTTLYGIDSRADTFIWAPGDGSDTIQDFSAGNNPIDTLRLTGVAQTDVKLARAGSDLVVTDTATAESITVRFEFPDVAAGNGIEQIAFDDGTVWSRATIDANAVIYGTSGNDTLNGSADGEIFDSLAGNDTVNGNGGGDTFIDRAQSGNDTFYESGLAGDTNTLRLVGVSTANVVLARAGNDLIVERLDSGKSVTVTYQFAASQPNFGVQQIVFDDGTAWNRATIKANAVTYGTSGNDTIYGTSDPETFDSLAGNDTVNGNGGGDTFIDRAQSGNDTFYENGLAGDTNTLRLVGVSEANVRLDRSGNDLIVERLDSGKSITVTYQFAASQPNFGVQQIAFDDGTVWNKATIKANAEIFGTAGDDTLNGTGDNETFDGLGGNDTYFDHSGASDTFVYASSYGNDTIDYQVFDSAHTGTLHLTDVNPSGVTLTKNGTELYVNVNATGNTIHDVGHFSGATRGIDQIAFADGTVWNRSTIDANAHPPLTGGAGDYLLTHGSGHVTVFASTITGTIRVPFGIAASDIILQGDNAGNLTVGVRGSGDSVTLTGDLASNWWGISSVVANVTFVDGSTMALAQPGYNQGHPPVFTWIGTATTTVLVGCNFGTNVFDLGPGGDTITGGNTSLGLSGVNTFVFDKGDGHAQVNFNGGTGTLQMAADIAASDVILQADNNGNLTVKLRDASDSITFASDLTTNWWGIGSHLQQIAYADGTSVNVAQPGYNQGQPPTFTWIGTATATTLTGSNYGSNVFDLGPGGDTITGGNVSLGASGVNTFVFEKGDGQAQVNFNGGTGTLQMAADIAASDVILQADNSGNLIVKLLDTGDSITFASDLTTNWWGIGSHLQQIAYADGTSVNVAQPGYNQGQPPTFTWIGTAGVTTLTGSNYGSNVFDLGPGGDTVTGGNTSLGASGANTLVFDKGDGQAQVNLNGGTGTIHMAADIAASDVILQADSGGDLIVKLRDAADSITVAHDLAAQWWGVSTQVSQISFADGSSLTIGQPVYNTGPAPTFTWIGTAGNDTLTGSAFGNNVFEGGAGNDTINGGGGYDTYKFTSGFGQSIINNLASDGSSPKGEIDFGAGVAHDQLWFARSGNDLQIDLLGTNQDLTISGWYAGNARAQVQSVHAGDGLKLDSQLQQLVAAMATYSANHTSFNPTQSQMPTDQTLQTTIAAAWH